MTPKEKALYLVLTYAILPEGCNDIVKRCATIAVDEIIENNQGIWRGDKQQGERLKDNLKIEYWNNVKLEIEKL